MKARRLTVRAQYGAVITLPQNECAPLSPTFTPLHNISSPLVRRMAILSEAPTQICDSLNGMTLDSRGGNYILGEVIYRRGDCFVVETQRTDASGRVYTTQLVIKIRVPRAARPLAEEKLINKGRAAAIGAGGTMRWVLQHIPNTFHTEDLQIIPGSMQARVAEGLHNASCETCEERIIDKLYLERRPLRIVIMEELFPISTLGDPSQYAQVFFDILNCYKCYYDNARIFHRDISMSNITYRSDDEGRIYGVLIDMGLSSDLDDLKATSLRRTGTPPFMAIDLLRKYSLQPEHIHRHDLESLFYVMLILFTRYELEAAEPTSSRIQDRAERLARRRKAPLTQWFDSTLSWEALSKEKEIFLARIEAPDSPLHMNNIISSSFQGFKDWIWSLKDALQDGFHAQTQALRQEEKAKIRGKAPAPFDYATLGGEFQYSTFFDVMKNFGDKALRAPPQSLDIDDTMEL
ncbi:hypothetical protein BDZ89DRAFT_409497 [Hymenopellis radicata]|nr:hypothetical protein BDZ89DRAFT_409497 [Hymenopellis radicata]